MKKILVLSLLFILSTSCFAAITDNLVLYLPYDEGAGAITHDSSGNGFDGKLFSQTDNQVAKWAQPVVNDNHWTAGKFGNAIKFYNGTFQLTTGGTGQKAIVDSHILGKNVYVENSTGNPYSAQEWSYSFWVRRPTDRSIYNMSSWVNAWDVQDGKVLTSDETCVDLWQNGDLRYDHVHTRYSDGGSGSSRYLKTGFNAGTIWIQDNIGTALGTGPNGNGQWVNIIMTVNGEPSGTPRKLTYSVYVNGVLCTRVADADGGWGYFPTEVFTMGSTTMKGIDQNDDIDDVGVWNRILTPAEIAWLQTNPIKPTQLLSPQLLSPDNQGVTNPDGTLTWQAGPSGPFNSYDVFLGTNLDEVDAAKNILCSSLEGDVDNDCDVDAQDLELIATCWLQNSSCNLNADLFVSSTIDFSDYAVMAGEWIQSGSPSYKGNQTGTSYNFSGLAPGTYYWRIDGIKNGVGTAKGNVRSFTVVPVWKQTEFVNYMGWTELGQFQESLKAPYAQAMYDLGIRHAQDSGNSIAYFYPKGVKVFLYYNPTPGSIAAQYRNTPGNAGYFQFDEPKNGSAGKTMADVANYHQQCHDADPGRPSYTNLYSSDGIGGGMGGLQSYINTFFDAFTGTAKPEILSYDYYSYRYGISNHWSNLEVYRQNALNKNIPLWNWVETCQGSTSSYPGSTTNKNRMRWCMYSSLTYGVKGFAWFNIEKAIYAIKSPDPGYGNRTYALGAAYGDVQAVNAEINRLGTVMVPLTSTAVYHTNSPTSYTRALPGDFWIQVTHSDSGFVLGTFTDASNIDYAMVSNKSDSSSVNNKEITFKQQVSSVLMFNEGTGGWDGQTVNGSYPNQYVTISMGPGYGKLLKIIKP